MPDPKTLRACVDEYVAHLRALEKAENTVGAYASDLNLAVRHFGAEKLMAKFIAAHVQGFFESELVNRRSGGEPKAAISVAKTKRAVRQFFDWAARRGYVSRSPVPARERPARRDRAGAAAE